MPRPPSNPRIPGERFLHSPGPTHIPAEVLDAMHRQPMDHGDPRLDAVIANCEEGLRALLKTAQADVFMYATNGHGVWEATTENLLAPGQAALIPSTGHFSEQWALQLEAGDSLVEIGVAHRHRNRIVDDFRTDGCDRFRL